MSMSVMISKFDLWERKSEHRLNDTRSDEIVIKYMLTRGLDIVGDSALTANAALAWLPMTGNAFATDVTPQNELVYGQLSLLQEYSQKLKRATRIVTQELESSDKELWKYRTYNDLSHPISPETWAVCTPAPNFLSPSLNLPFAQGYFGNIQEDIWAYVVTIDRKVSESLREFKRRLQWALRRVNIAITVILGCIARSFTGFFCSIRWERRRWFVRHGARPPKIRITGDLQPVS